VKGSLGQAGRFHAVRPALDRQALREYFNTRIRWPAGTSVSAVAIRRFWPGSRDRVDVEYDLKLRTSAQPDGTTVTLYARHPALNGEAGAERTAAELSEHGLAGLSFIDPRLDVTFHSFDRDPSLPQIGRCLDPSFMTARLAALQRRGTDAALALPDEAVDCRPMAYRRGKRIVIRYRNASLGSSARGLVGKSYADDRGAALAEVHRRLGDHLAWTTSGLVRLPAAVGYDPELRMVLANWAGSSTPVPPRCSPESWARCAAATLVALQSARLPDLPRHDERRHWEVLERWHAAIADLCPDLYSRAQSLVQLLAAAWDALSPRPPVVVHGDFYESQLIVKRRTTTIVDLDTLAWGDECLDLGNYLAHQWLWCLEKGLPPESYASIVRAMLEAYESQAFSIDETALACYWAGSLFRVGAIHAFRDRTARYTVPLWRLIEPVLGQGPEALDLPAVRRMLLEPDSHDMSLAAASGGRRDASS